jgi:hypothetical protein
MLCADHIRNAKHHWWKSGIFAEIFLYYWKNYKVKTIWRKRYLFLSNCFQLMICVDTYWIEISARTPKETNNGAIAVHWNVERVCSPCSKWSIATSAGDKCKRRYNVQQISEWTNCSRYSCQKLRRTKLNLQENEKQYFSCWNIPRTGEKAYSLLVTRAPVAPQVLGSTPRGSEFLRI